MVDSGCPDGESRLYIEDGVVVNSYVGEFPLGRRLASGGLRNVFSGRLAFLTWPRCTKSFDATERFCCLSR